MNVIVYYSKYIMENNNFSNIKTAFIIGTGRCGTTILGQIFGKHPDIFVARKEFRILIDPDGLISLKRGFVDDWSPNNAHMAIKRFKQLIKSFGTCFAPYPGVSLREVFGKKDWDIETKRFIEELISFAYKGAWGGEDNLVGKVILHYFNLRRFNPFIKKIYYHGALEEKYFFEISQKFVYRIIEKKLDQLKKNIWIDHTPGICLHPDFIIKLFPQAKFLYIYRDPRDVVCSYKSVDWAPDDTFKSAEIVRDILERWSNTKIFLPKNSFIEIKFEDLVEDTSGIVDYICNWLGISSTREMIKFDLSKNNMGRWKTDLSDNEKEFLNKAFSEYLISNGYSLTTSLNLN